MDIYRELIENKLPPEHELLMRFEQRKAIPFEVIGDSFSINGLLTGEVKVAKGNRITPDYKEVVNVSFIGRVYNESGKEVDMVIYRNLEI